MADLVKYVFGTEAQIMALIPGNVNWIEKAFYYPSDRNYFYQIVDNEMKKYGDVSYEMDGVGITLNGLLIGGFKNYILLPDVLNIPENFEYNGFLLQVDGVINCDGSINLI
jgi:hypothetical protein